MEMIQTGREFKTWRLSKGFSQKGAAKRLGLHPATLSRVETRDLRIDQRWVEVLSGRPGGGDDFADLLRMVLGLDEKKREILRLVLGG